MLVKYVCSDKRKYLAIPAAISELGCAPLYLLSDQIRNFHQIFIKRTMLVN